MADIELAPEIQDDFERILNHLASNAGADNANQSRIDEIIAALDILEMNPLIGRPVAAQMRELVIGRKAHCYVALYSFIEIVDTAFVLAIRHARDAGYSRGWEF